MMSKLDGSLFKLIIRVVTLYDTFCLHYFTNLGKPVKSLKVSVIITFFGYIFLLTMETADLSAYHDLGPKHFDSNLSTPFQASQNKQNYSIPQDAIIFSLNLYEYLPQIFSLITEETWNSTFSPHSKVPSRAPPA
jgi:hypothetical protein